MDYLTTPNGLMLQDGSVVMLARFPGTKWVVRNGWYTYQNSQYTGWYFSSIPAQTVLPVNNEDLSLITVISGGVNSSCGCAPNPGVPVTPPTSDSGDSDSTTTPPPPKPGEPMSDISKAFITVQDLNERDMLKFTLIPNGKLVRVNNVDGEVKYYQYNQADSVFEEITFGSDNSEEISEIKETIEEIENYINWMNIEEEVI